MKQFYQERLASHQKKLMTYLKYVFNDHMMIAMTFILGGLGLYYSNFVKTLTPDFKVGYVIIWLILLFSLHIGKLATLIKEADKVFLLPKEKQMHEYLGTALRHSLIMPFFAIILITGACYPLLLAIKSTSLVELVFIIMSLLALKIAHLVLAQLNFFVKSRYQAKKIYGIWLLASVIVIALALWQPLFSLPIAVATALLSFVHYNRTKQIDYLDWSQLIQSEESRMKRIYRFINLFTDVPGMPTTVHRRKYFDPILAKIKSSQDRTFDYLYARHFLRGSDYGGLVFRLTIIGGLALFFIDQTILASGLGLLIIFLIGFQLLPMVNAFNYISAVQLYPVAQADKTKSLSRLIQIVLFSISIIFSLIALISFNDKAHASLFILLSLLEVVIFTRFYLPKKLQKMTNL